MSKLVSYILKIEDVDGEYELFGPFDTNDKAMEFGQLVADEDEDIAAFSSLRLKSPSSRFGGHAV